METTRSIGLEMSFTPDRDLQPLQRKVAIKQSDLKYELGVCGFFICKSVKMISKYIYSPRTIKKFNRF